MTLRELGAVKGMREAVAALVVAGALCVWVYRRAITTDPLPDPKAGMTVVAGALDAPPKVTDIDVMNVVASDIFAVDRKAPAKRYRMPFQAEPGPEPAKPVVLGTTLGDAASSFCTCQLGSSRLIFAHVGDVLGIYTVKSIERGKVVFNSTAGKPLEILALKPGS